LFLSPYLSHSAEEEGREDEFIYANVSVSVYAGSMVGSMQEHHRDKDLKGKAEAN